MQHSRSSTCSFSYVYGNLGFRRYGRSRNFFALAPSLDNRIEMSVVTNQFIEHKLARNFACIQ
jgi:hypothetical protein